MSRTSKLILVEGLCGAGKSTLAERLHLYLAQQGVSSSFYDEGASGHPVSLNGHAFFRQKEFEDLLRRYPNTADAIRSRVIQDGSSYLLPYREVTAFNGSESLAAELKSRELCWTDSPPATQAEFTYSIQQQWARFAKLNHDSDEVYVLEAVFIQHQIHDLLRLYQANDQQIEQHIQEIAKQLAAMHPVLIYLSQPNVREQQTWISSVRSKPRFASEPNIQFMENRKRIELGLLDKLPFPTHIIENIGLDWEAVFRQMVEVIE